MFGREVIEAARRHALAEAPGEACGVVRGGQFEPWPNIAANPQRDFQLDPRALAGAQAVIHSHVSPALPWPTPRDLKSQPATGVPWGIVYVNEGEAFGPIWFTRRALLIEDQITLFDRLIRDLQ